MVAINTTCCIVGGGPAGMMSGFLLARAGVDVIVLEKHGDFFRDFRGDTVHPSTLELLYELGIIKSFLNVPHDELTSIGGEIGNDLIQMADFSHLPTHCKFLAFMPQWDFLNFISAQAKQYKTFSLRMKTKAVGLIEENGKIVGVRAEGEEGPIEIRSDLVIASDGRSSTIREAANMTVLDIGAPMDVLWFRLSRSKSDPPQTLGRVRPGLILITLNRGEYWQCGYVIAKGQLDVLKEKGLDAFKANTAKIAPFTADRVDELTSWDDIKLLTVKVDRLQQWYKDGLLCIGDAAHAMSPIGGVGINLAVQDAVAAANILWKPLSEKNCTETSLAAVQARRSYPTTMTQKLQVFLQKRMIEPTLASSAESMNAPALIKMFNVIPALRQLPARVIGIGFRPEHIRSPNRAQKG